MHGAMTDGEHYYRLTLNVGQHIKMFQHPNFTEYLYVQTSAYCTL